MSDLDKTIEEQMLIAFKLGALDTLGGPNKPDPLPVLREAGDNIKQAFEQAGYVTGQEWYKKFEEKAPKQFTESDKLDFNLHDDDPEGNCYYAYNCAIAEMCKAAKRVVGHAEQLANAVIWAREEGQKDRKKIKK